MGRQALACLPPRSRGLAALTDLEDGGIEDDMGVLHRQLPLLGQTLDLIVPAEQDRLDALLPGHPDLLQKRVVVRLTGLGAKHGQLALGRTAAHELGDSISSGFEVLLVVACIAALLRGRGHKLRRGATVGFTLGTAALTTLAFLSVLRAAPSVLPSTM